MSSQEEQHQLLQLIESSSNNLAPIQCFLNQHTDLDFGIDLSPIILAAQTGRFQVVRLLAEYVDVNERDMSEESSSFRTALHYAAEAGDVETVTALIAHDAELNPQDINGLTPLMLAEKQNDEGTIRILLNHGADALITDLQGKSVIDYAQEAGRTQRVALYLNRAKIEEGLKSANREEKEPELVG